MSVRNKITLEEEKKICDLFLNEGLSPIQIGEQMNRDKSTIRRILKRNDIQYNNINYISEDELHNIISDYQSGMTPKELSDKYNRNDGHLIKILRQKGVYINSTLRLKKEDWSKIADYYSKGDNEQIFKLYPSLSQNSLISKMSKMGIRSGRRNWWSEEDRQIVSDLYYYEDVNVIYELIGYRHSKDAIESFALNELGYSRGYNWTEQEDTILKENYSSKSIDEVLKLLPNRSHMAIQCRAKKFGLVSNYRICTYWTKEENEFLLQHWKEMSDYQIGLALNRNPSTVKDRRNLLGYYRINKEYMGYETIKRLLRARTWGWKQKSMEKCDYRCILTGDKDFHIHHLYGFNDIFNKFIKENNITEQLISNYSFDELDKMCDDFVIYHDKYPLGVCVRADLHVLFHELYGKHGNTPEQWEEFVLNNK